MTVDELKQKYLGDDAFSKAANTAVESIAAKYGVTQADATGGAIENLKALVAKAKKAVKAKSGDRNAMARLMNELVMARSAARSEYDTLAKEAYNLSGELDNIASNFKKGK